jgi:broad specificity phosphatase PhoE
MSKTTPRLIILIRHAEKPPGDVDPDLSADGRRRAAMLAEELPKLYTGDDKISVIVAAKRSPNSNRSVETVEPIAKALGLAIDTRFKDEQHAELAAELLGGSYAGKTILVCWHHEKMEKLARNLGIADAPKALKDDVFDRLWEIRYGDDGGATLTEKQQPLVPAS